MFKKYKLIIALLIVGLVSSMFGQTVGASANDHATEKEIDRFVFQGKINQDSYAELERYLSKILAKWNVKWQDKAWKKYERPHHVEQPVEKEPETEIPVEEVPEQKVEQPTQPEQNEQINQEEQPEQNNNQHEASELNEFEQQVFALTNEERQKHGLQALQIDYEVSRVAREKSRDMAVNNYFDHNSPTYGSPFDMIRAYGINYQSAGENIAKGQRTPAEVVNAWMNSEGHRANILNSSYTHIGVGYVEQGNHWTQQFIGK